MKFLLGGLAVVGSLMAFTGCEPAKPTGADIQSWDDSLSYAIGVDIATSMKKSSISINPEMLAAGYRDQNDSTAVFDEDDLKLIMQKFQTIAMKKQEEERTRVADENRAKGEQWLASNKTQPGVITTPSGLQYKVLTEGTGPKPTLADTVTVHYAGHVIDDAKEFDSSYKRGEPATAPASIFMRGWQEALQMMSVGSKWELYIPSDMAYGPGGYPPDIGPNATLVFTVELLDVIKGTGAPAGGAPENARGRSR